MPPKAAVAAPADQKPDASATSTSILQTVNISLQPPKNTEQWSAWYVESADTFADFKSYEPAATATGGQVPASGGSMRTLSARQISGQFDEEVAKSWEEDWEDEDLDDTFDYIIGQMSRIEASRAATGQN